MNGTSSYSNDGAGVAAPTATPAVVLRGNTSEVHRTSFSVERFMPAMDIEQAVSRRQLIVDATSKLMQVGVDYGKIPGTERETLLQPGADKLCNLFGIVLEYEIIRRV